MAIWKWKSKNVLEFQIVCVVSPFKYIGHMHFPKCFGKYTRIRILHWHTGKYNTFTRISSCWSLWSYAVAMCTDAVALLLVVMLVGNAFSIYTWLGHCVGILVLFVAFLFTCPSRLCSLTYQWFWNFTCSLVISFYIICVELWKTHIVDFYQNAYWGFSKIHPQRSKQPLVGYMFFLVLTWPLLFKIIMYW